jgi:acyl-CoA hydrolase
MDTPAPPNPALKAKYAFYSTLIFFLIANPETFKMTQNVFGGWLFTIADTGGCPTATGFFFHTTAFFLVLWAAMLFPR